MVAGHYGEALRGLDLRMSRRNGRVRSFSLNAKIGRDTALIGDMRTRVSSNRPVLYFETSDAGALFRFTDVYPRMVGGKIWVVMDPPTQDQAPQAGLINVRDFSIRGEGALERVVSNNQQDARNNIEFTQAQAEFTRTPGRTTIRDGVVKGPLIGATMEGLIDYARDEVNVRGTLVPLYGLNNMFGQIPIVGLFLGGGATKACSASPTRSTGRRATRGRASIRSRRSRPDCCANSSSSAITRTAWWSSRRGRFVAGKSGGCRRSLRAILIQLHRVSPAAWSQQCRAAS